MINITNHNFLKKKFKTNPFNNNKKLTIDEMKHGYDYNLSKVVKNFKSNS